MLLTRTTTAHFPPGTEVRVKRHGYERHYVGTIRSVQVPTPFEDRDDYHDPVLDWTVVVALDAHRSMAFTIEGDYAVCATADTAWQDIPSPGSEEAEAYYLAEVLGPLYEEREEIRKGLAGEFGADYVSGCDFPDVDRRIAEAEAALTEAALAARLNPHALKLRVALEVSKAADIRAMEAAEPAASADIPERLRRALEG